MENEVSTMKSINPTPSIDPPTTPAPKVKVSWFGLGTIAVLFWLFFLGGWEWIVTPAPSSAPTTVFQTATLLPTGEKIKEQPVGVPAAPNIPVATRSSVVVPIATTLPVVSAVPFNPADQVSIAQTAEAASLLAYRQTAAAVDLNAGITATTVDVSSANGSKDDTRDRPTAAPTAILMAPADAAVNVNIQQTHTCKHGQVWVDDKGCRWPDGALSDRHP